MIPIIVRGIGPGKDLIYFFRIIRNNNPHIKSMTLIGLMFARCCSSCMVLCMILVC